MTGHLDDRRFGRTSPNRIIGYRQIKDSLEDEECSDNR